MMEPDDRPWLTEPDRVEWIDPSTDLDCLIIRNKNLGNLCGYVAVPKGHRLYGVDYSDIDTELRVHGDCTYSGRCQGEICHIPAAGRTDDVWWFGFDCGRAFDLVPRFLDTLPDLEIHKHTTYRDIEYVREQCTQLAAQLK